MGTVDLDELVSPDGSTVSRRAITDPEVYDAEMERIFGRSWLCVAHESQLPAPGRFVTSWMGEVPVIVSRDRDGEVHVVLNSCSHRASRVCRVDQGEATTFTCPNHGWSFGSDGRLLGIPRVMEGYGSELDRASLGLLRARVEIYCQLVFATFDPGAPSLSDYLGDAAYYLETIFGRYRNGTEVLAGTQKVVIECNWKLAAENLGTDLQHPEIAHGAFMDLWPDPVMDFMHDSEQVMTSGGHPIGIGRRPPPYTERDMVLATLDDATERREVDEWFDRTNAEAIEILGETRANTYVFTGSVFPNLSFLPGVSSVSLLHPRGPHHMEWWSWCLVASDAPAAVKAHRRMLFMLTAGPGGLILAEDAENWADMTRSNGGAVAERLPLHIGRGDASAEYSDPELPGALTGMRTEHLMRGFWRHWREAMALSS